MEQDRENTGRGGRPDGSTYGDGSRQRSEYGFEGMNYEQRREPYFSKRNQAQNGSAGEKGSAGEGNHDEHAPVG